MTSPALARTIRHERVASRARTRVGHLFDLTLTRSASVAAFAVVAVLGAADGGYFPRHWGWAALVLLWVAAVGFVVRARARYGVFEVCFLGAAAELTALIALSTLWSTSVPATLQELERMLVYLAGLVAILALARRSAVGASLGGILAAIVLVSTYALGTRLFPERLGGFDPMAGARLSEPFGYWNALGIFAALGSLLALGFAARGNSLPARGLGGAAVTILIPTVYFTFGRGPWIGLGVGIVAMVALDPRRLQLLSALLAASIGPAVAVWLAARSDGLTQENASLEAATREGHRLALALLALGILSGLFSAGVAYLEGKVRITRTLRLAYAGTLVTAVAVALGLVFVRYGAPPTLAEKAWESFHGPPPTIRGDLNRRLFSLSGNGRADHWEVALDQRREHPWLGSGAGTFEQSWYENRSVATPVRDAHSLYLETLAELGPVGLALLLATLAVPIAAAIKMRRYRLASAALGAYVAYLVHAGMDWDWEMPAVTLAALFSGAALVVAARPDQARVLSGRIRAALVVAVLALSAFAFVGLMGNNAIAASEDAVDNGNWSEAAAEARKAMDWMPWSPQPWEALAEAQLGTNDLDGARESFRRAIEKDERDWSLWFDLALLSEGAERDRALARAHELNPLDPEIAQLIQER
jgi:O-Antigen ligase